jgi:hypothetical protein
LDGNAEAGLLGAISSSCKKQSRVQVQLEAS